MKIKLHFFVKEIFWVIFLSFCLAPGLNAQTTISTNFTNNNGFSQVTFNFQNTNSYPVTITDISSVIAAGSENVEAWYNTTAISGQPPGISSTYGWTMFGSATVSNGNGTSVVPLMSGLSLVIPAGATYGISVAASGTIYYSTLTGGTFTFSGGGCNIITGDNIGYGGAYPPGSPINTPRGFIGSVTFIGALPCSGTPTAAIITNTVITTPLCAGNVDTLIATDPNQPASGITYQWQQASAATGPWANVTGGSGATSLTYTTPALSANTWYQLDITCSNSGTTTPSAAYEVPVDPIVTPAVSVSINPGDTICMGTSVTFTANGTGGGTSPSYEWEKNGSAVGSNSTYTDNAIASGDYIYCIFTSNAPCATQFTDTSATDTALVYPLPTTPVITANGHVLSTGTNTSYQWYLNTTAISGATNMTYTVAQNGSYTVKVTDAHGCSATSTVHVVANVSVANINPGIDMINLYPNPNNGNFIVTGNIRSGSDKYARIEIIDLIGKIIYKDAAEISNGSIKKEINAGNNLAPGMYMLRVSYETDKTVLPFAKQ